MPMGNDVSYYALMDAPADLLQFSESLKAKKQYVCVLEEVALAAPHFNETVRELIRGRQVIHFADNKAANSAAIKGGSSASDMARIVSAMHLRWCADGINVWIEFVASESNLADLPSRGDTRLVEELGASKLEFTMPPFEGWG